MAYEPNPVKALIKSKKFQLVLGWTGLLLFLASTRATVDQAVSLIQSGSIVISAYLISQGIVDAVATYVGRNGKSE